MIRDLLNQNASRRAACKQWSVILSVSILLIGAWGRLGAVNVVWAAAPLFMLGLAEAGYAAQERKCAELLQSGEEKNEAIALMPEAAGASVVRMVMAVLSLSVWPFYVGLIGIVVAGSSALPAASREPVISGSHIMQAPSQPYASVATGPVTYPGQMPQMHSQNGQQPGQMPPGMTQRQPVPGQNFPGRPPFTPPPARKPLGTGNPASPVASPRPNVSVPKPVLPGASAVTPGNVPSTPANKPPGTTNGQ